MKQKPNRRAPIEPHHVRVQRHIVQSQCYKGHRRARYTGLRGAGQHNGGQSHEAHQQAGDGVVDVCRRVWKPAAHIALLNQAVEMQPIRMTKVHLLDLAAVDAEQHPVSG